MLKDDLVDYDPVTGRMGSPPRQVCLELTSRCNHQCVTCSVDYGRTGGYELADLPLETIRRLGPWLAEAHSVNLNIVGEPLIYPHFAEVLAEMPRFLA